ncbi:tyrosyl-DNA phosphodiesterase 1 [Mortierella claussenii]|nr:tyrosyl-DNA phosphodiesterase 1 [Mortierella claussenii]
MVQINYMIEIDFVMSKVHESIRDRLDVIVYHGLRLTAGQIQAMESTTRIKYPRVVLNHVPVPGIGTHHTKAMLLFYRDGSMQLVIHTANMIERDWRNKTQAVFATGRLPKKELPSVLPNCAFERDLIEYLQHYHNHVVFTSRVSQYDFTDIRGVLVGSVPGKFTGPDKNKWGHLRLRAALRQQVELPNYLRNNSKIICQVSSVGSLGKESQDWLRGEFETSLNAHRHASGVESRKAGFCVVYPTAENVRTSYKKQAHYLNPLLHSWKAANSGRERAMPHIKTFSRITTKSDGDYISWFLLTSANMSKPAWGEMKPGSVLSVQSYELGILLFPGLFENVGESGENLHVYMMNETLADPYPEPRSVQLESGHNEDSELQMGQSIGVVRIRLPFDLPLKQYDHSTDHVWLTDKYFPGTDDFGNTLEA